MPATWAELPHVRELQSITRLNEHRWLVADRWRLALWDENGEGPSLAHHQRQTRTLPALGVVVAYGDPRLVYGADPEASTAPRVQVFGFDGDLLGLVASFAVDGKELVVEHSDAGLRLGLISVDADVAWALEGLEAAVQQWRDTARARAEAFAAALSAFGELTLDRVVEALRTLLGCAYGPGYQTALDEVFEPVIAPLEADPSWRGAAQAADSPRAFIPTFRGPFATALLEQKRGIAFSEFALRCTTLDPAQSDLVLLAASTSAWLRLRGMGST